MRIIKGIGTVVPPRVQPSAYKPPPEPVRQGEALLAKVPEGRACHTCANARYLMALIYSETPLTDPTFDDVFGYTCGSTGENYPLDDGPRRCRNHRDR